LTPSSCGWKKNCDEYAENVARLIENGEGPRLMIFLHGYFDESMPGQPEPQKLIPEYVVLGGFVEMSDNLLDFYIEWGKALERPRSIEYFHGFEANGCIDQFEGFSKEEQIAKVKGLLNVICSGTLAPLVSAVHPEHYASLLREFPGVMPEDPYIFCFLQIMWEAIDLNRQRIVDDEFEFTLVFEENEEKRKKANAAFDYVCRRSAEFKKVLKGGISFLDKKRYKPLQAADALVYDLNKEYTRELRRPRSKPRPSFDLLVNNLKFRGLFTPWTYEHLRKQFEHADKSYKEIQMAKPNKEYENFNSTMQKLIKVPHAEIKAALDAEKAEKRRKRKVKDDDSRNKDNDSIK
jgi:hypothetical protein